MKAGDIVKLSENGLSNIYWSEAWRGRARKYRFVIYQIKKDVIKVAKMGSNRIHFFPRSYFLELAKD